MGIGKTVDFNKYYFYEDSGIDGVKERDVIEF